MIKNKFNILPIILLVLTLSIVAFAGSPLPDYKPQFFDANGNPLTSGSLKLCNPGTTNVKTIYTNSSLTVPKANPVNLDSSGRAEVWLNGTYDVYLYDGQNATGNLIYTLYNISSISAASSPFTPNYVDASEYGDLTATITSLGIVTPYEVWVTDQQTLTADTTIPATITLRVIRGGMIVADGYKLTFDGPLDATPEQQIFSGFTADTMGVIFTYPASVYPEWWGAVGNASAVSYTGTDDTTAIQSTICSLTSGGIIHISKLYGIAGTSSGTFNTGVYLQHDSITFQGSNNRMHGFVQTCSAPLIMFRSYYGSGEGYRVKDISFQNIRFQGNGYTYHDAGNGASSPITIYSFRRIRVNGCYLANWSIIGGITAGTVTEDANRSYDLWFTDNYVFGQDGLPYVGLLLENVDRVYIERNNFDYISRPCYLEVDEANNRKILNVHFDNNTITHGSVSTVSSTNAFVAFGASTPSSSYTGNEVGYISAIGNKIIDCSTGVTSGTPAPFLFLSGSGTQGTVHDITVIGNTVDNYTPTAGSATDIGCYLKNIDNATVIGNTFNNPLAASIMYGILIDDSRYCKVLGNSILGADWAETIRETATIECRNSIIDNTVTSTTAGGTFSNFATSKSQIHHFNAQNSRYLIYNDGYYIGRYYQGDLYDKNSNKVYGIQGVPLNDYIVKWSSTYQFPYWSAP